MRKENGRNGKDMAASEPLLAQRKWQWEAVKILAGVGSVDGASEENRMIDAE